MIKVSLFFINIIYLVQNFKNKNEEFKEKTKKTYAKKNLETEIRHENNMKNLNILREKLSKETEEKEFKKYISFYFLRRAQENELKQKKKEKRTKMKEKKLNKEKDKNPIDNEEIPLQKEFLDQYDVFKEMFYFLTHKIPKNDKIGKAIINSGKKDKASDDKITQTKKKDEKIKNNSTNPKCNINKIKDNLTLELISEKSTEEINSPFYLKLKHYFNLYYNNFNSLIERNKVNPPFLPELDTNKYKYTLVLDLDETLVHYVEEENSAYVQVRPYADYFLKELSKHFEVVLFTAAEEDYTGIVLNELNKYNYITHILCRKYTEFKDGCYIKDLSKLGRDLSKVCIVDNNKDNFKLQPENGLFISSYYGEQNDNELYLLCGDLMKIIETQPEDIRPIIKQIDSIMQNRYVGA